MSTKAKKPKAAKEVPFHPFSEEYPLMPEADLAGLEDSMRARGYDPRFPIVLYKKQILDGRNRKLASGRAGVRPGYVTFRGTDEEAKAFVELANEHRRHLAPEWLQKRRQERVARIAEARKAGESIRAIAEKEGVSAKTIHQDLGKAGVTGVTPGPESATVKGRDGKAYPASQPLPPARGKAANAPAPPSRQPGDDTDEIAAEKAAEKARPKNGAVLYDLKVFHDAFGRLYRQMDALGNAYGQGPNGMAHRLTPPADRLKYHLSQFKAGFEAWLADLRRPGGKNFAGWLAGLDEEQQRARA